MKTRSMRVGLRVLALSVGVLAFSPRSAWAQAEAASPVRWTLELKGAPYKARVDSEFSGAKPFETIYGGSPVLLGMGELDYQFWRGVGSLAVGFSSGYALDNGTAIAGNGTKPGDTTRFNVVPLQLSAVYRFDWLAHRFSIPFVAFAKAGVDYWVWWFRGASGEIPKAAGTRGRGGNFGWHVGAGVQFLLDWIDPKSARAFDIEMGVNHSYVFFEYQYARIDNFGSSRALRIGDELFLVGLAFEM